LVISAGGSGPVSGSSAGWVPLPAWKRPGAVPVFST